MGSFRSASAKGMAILRRHMAGSETSVPLVVTGADMQAAWESQHSGSLEFMIFALHIVNWCTRVCSLWCAKCNGRALVMGILLRVDNLFGVFEPVGLLGDRAL